MKNDPYIVAAFLKAREQDKWAADGTRPLVTISRQRGAGGDLIAMRTAEVLTEMSHGKSPWVVVDKNIAQHVIEDHHLPQRIANFLTEPQVASVEEHIEGLLGIDVPRTELVKKMTQTMIHLARIGQVIFVGRAANVITAKFPRAVHVRVIGSFERRVERVMEKKECSHDEAVSEVMSTDEHRNRFVATHFHADLNDPMLYDLIVNTDRICVDEGARLIADLVSSPGFRDKEAQKLAELRHQVLG